jgi:hypothetical protein
MTNFDHFAVSRGCVGNGAPVAIAATVLLSLACVCGCEKTAMSAGPATTPAPTAPAQTMPTTSKASTAPTDDRFAVVSKLQGVAQWRVPADAPKPNPPWEALAVGRRLPLNATIRTGAKSSVVLTLSDNTTVSIDRLTEVTIARAIETSGKTGTAPGRPRFDISGPDNERESPTDGRNSELKSRS